jgi:Right handed beta helix region
MRNTYSIAFVTILLMIGLVNPAFSQTVTVDPVSGTDNGATPFLTIQAAVAHVQGNAATPDVVQLMDNAQHIMSATLGFSLVGADLTINTVSGQAVVVCPNFTDAVDLQNNGAIVCTATNSTLLVENITLLPPPSSVVGSDGAVGGDGTNGMNGFVIHADSVNSTITLRNMIITGNNNANQPTSTDGSVDWIGVAGVTVWPGACARLNANVDMTYNVENCVMSQTADQCLNVNQNVSTATTTPGPTVNITGTGVYSYGTDYMIHLNVEEVTINASAADAIDIHHGLTYAIRLYKARNAYINNIKIRDHGNVGAGGGGDRGIVIYDTGPRNFTLTNSTFDNIEGTNIRTYFTAARIQAGGVYVVDNCTFDRSGGQAWYDNNSLAGSGLDALNMSITVTNCTVTNTFYCGMRFRAFMNVTVRNCHFQDNGFTAVGNGNALSFNSTTGLWACGSDAEGATVLVEDCTINNSRGYALCSYAADTTYRRISTYHNGGPSLFNAGSGTVYPYSCLYEDCTSVDDAWDSVFTAAAWQRPCSIFARGQDITIRRCYVQDAGYDGVRVLSDWHNDMTALLEDVTVVNATGNGFRVESTTSTLRRCNVNTATENGIWRAVDSHGNGTVVVKDSENPSQNDKAMLIEDCVISNCGFDGINTDTYYHGPLTVRTSQVSDSVGSGVLVSSASSYIDDCTMINNGNAGLWLGFGTGPNAMLDTVVGCALLNNANYGIYIGEAQGPLTGSVTNCTILDSPDCIHVEGLAILQALDVSDCILAGTGNTGINVASTVIGPGISVNHSALVQNGPHALSTSVVDANSPSKVTIGGAVIDIDPIFVSTNPVSPDFFAVDSALFQSAGSGGAALVGSSYLRGNVDISAWRLY